ncbi:unnamed protein product [Rangifer tarandus platyrhynchus]|uniref:Uncharacterized protein n=1 Tax=Rangifer tarandus platyrhynchus TaxID=3082113 RepID=A0ABN8XLZ7_RANTA|nr:unnamed protein product [Rangifer tarandus platyrhynchus]
MLLRSQSRSALATHQQKFDSIPDVRPYPRILCRAWEVTAEGRCVLSRDVEKSERNVEHHNMVPVWTVLRRAVLGEKHALFMHAGHWLFGYSSRSANATSLDVERLYASGVPAVYSFTAGGACGSSGESWRDGEWCTFTQERVCTWEAHVNSVLRADFASSMRRSRGPCPRIFRGAHMFVCKVAELCHK